MTATRRLAAIMAIDVVGYSRLMGEDEAVSKNLRVARRMDNILSCRKHSQ